MAGEEAGFEEEGEGEEEGEEDDEDEDEEKDEVEEEWASGGGAAGLANSGRCRMSPKAPAASRVVPSRAISDPTSGVSSGGPRNGFSQAEEVGPAVGALSRRPTDGPTDLELAEARERGRQRAFERARGRMRAQRTGKR